MDGHWADQIIRDIDVLSDDRYARFPFSDNVHVRRLVDAYQRLGALHFAEPGVESERQNLRIRIHNVFKRMEERQVSLVVAGGWNAGKSTVINAFLGESWMPMNVNRETVTVNRILGGSERYLHVHFREGHLPRQLRQAYQDVDFVHHKIREFGESHRDAIERIDICYPGHPFLTWLALIDTPGLDFSARDDRVSQPLIDDADVLVWVMHIEG
ncbi:MAG: dynamin family protein, partial [Nitrospira sp.]|nr:dynamin family protein [Nitrospira sp.]